MRRSIIIYPIARIAERNVQMIPGIANIVAVPVDGIPVSGGHK
jgi:hypothetical protein